MSEESRDESAEGADRPSIRALDDRTIQRIAAGEVVERPASVVKELVENALDAGADRIDVAVEAGGTEGIRVRDDGVGMTADQLSVAVEEHTTSKIDDIDDLEAGVGTLGFRGEALHTIGAVSRLTIRSRPRADASGDAAGTAESSAGAEITIEGGDVGEVRPAGCPEGTTVEVADLFFNTPARRKFLKTEATEFAHVNTVVTHYALANPDVAVSLEHDGREVFATQGDDSLRSAVLAVYGRDVAESMIEVEWSPEGGVVDDGDGGTDSDRDSPVTSIHGLVSHPETTRSTREYLSTFVNGRYVTASTLREGVLDAYGGQLASDRYPFAVLFVEVAPDAVDVNVHPRKMEVRFDDESGVRDAVEAAVESALLDHGLVRSSAPRGRSRAAEAEVRPEPPADEAVGGAGTGHEDAADVSAGESRRTRERSTVDRGDSESTADSESTRDEAAGDAVPDDRDGAVAGDSGRTQPTDGERPSPRSWQETEIDASDRPDADDRQSSLGSSLDASAGVSGGSSSNTTDDSWSEQTSHSRSDATEDPQPDATSDGTVDRASRGESAETAEGAETAESDGTTEGDGTTETADRETGGSAAGAFTPPTSQRTLEGENASVDRAFDRLPRLRVLGQFRDTYLVAESDDGLVLIDQHAADERINYERLQDELTGDTPTQALAEPVELELTAREAALFEQYREALAQLGFHAGRTGERTVEVRTVPAVFDATLEPSLLRDVLTAFVRDEADGGRETVDAVADSLLADLACYPSITGNTSLREGTVADLLDRLDGCENPYACPHGRPVIVSIDDGEIDDRFERDYPGHAHGRRE